MINFSTFLTEYLTGNQMDQYKDVHMSKNARLATDHFFGKGTDKIHGEIAGDHFHDKSEIHRTIERHLGKEIPHDDYHRGKTKDKYGREVKLGKIIKDPKLRDYLASDMTREGSKIAKSVFKTSTVRGIEVAGQTNPEPNHLHPSGHSWVKSCKNIKTGLFKDKLHSEIKHGTVVHFVHDHDGKEIYRVTLQPHHNEAGDTIYAVDSEYGVKHPAFTKSAHNTADKLSGEYKSDVFSKNSEVYDGNGKTYILHPNSSKEHIDKSLDQDKPFEERYAALQHRNVDQDHLEKAKKDKDNLIRSEAISRSIKV